MRLLLSSVNYIASARVTRVLLSIQTWACYCCRHFKKQLLRSPFCRCHHRPFVVGFFFVSARLFRLQSSWMFNRCRRSLVSDSPHACHCRMFLTGWFADTMQLILKSCHTLSGYSSQELGVMQMMTCCELLLLVCLSGICSLFTRNDSCHHHLQGHDRSVQSRHSGVWHFAQEHKFFEFAEQGSHGTATCQCRCTTRCKLHKAHIERGASHNEQTS